MPAHNLAMVIRTIGRLPEKSALAKLQVRLEERFGLSGAGKAERVSGAFLERLSAKLAAVNGDYKTLKVQEMRQVIHLLWGDVPPWTPGPQDAHRWLTGSDSTNAARRRQVNRVARTLVRKGREGPVTDLIRGWINAEGRRGLVRPPLRDLDGRWDLLGVSRPIRPVDSMARGETAFLDQIQGHPTLASALHGSALLAGILEGYAGTGRAWNDDAPSTWSALRLLFGAHGLASPDPARTRAILAILVPAIVAWVGGSIAREEPALEAVIGLLGDPRLEPARWADIPEETRRLVETWLMKQDFDALFKVIDEMAHVADQDAWPHRKAFWMRYLKDGSTQRLWLLLGPKARPIADRLKVRYGNLTSFDQGHCGLLMEISPGIVVLEMNNNGATRAWKRSNDKAPRFYEADYSFRTYSNTYDLRMPHQPSPDGWIPTFETQIAALRHRGS